MCKHRIDITFTLYLLVYLDRVSFCSGFHILVKILFKETQFSFCRLDKVRCKKALVITTINVAKSKEYCSPFLVAHLPYTLNSRDNIC